ncbi:MAG: hypothetical protein ACOC33_00980 [bacterium]
MEKTFIKTSHEEVYSKGETSKTIGILTNWDMDGNRIDSFSYIYNENDIQGTYIFFETMINMFDYLLYGDKKTKRSYMKEDKFDELYDNPINDNFSEYLNWLN